MRLSLLHEAESRRGLFKRFFGWKKNNKEVEDMPEKQEEESPFDMDRRGFIRTAGSAAASAASGISPVIGIAKKMHDVKSIYDAMSDEKLLKTPEEKWLDEIDPARRRQIARDHPEHGKREAVAKLYEILAYGLTNVVAGPKAAQRAKRNAERVKKAVDALGKISKTWNIKQSELMSNIAQYFQGDVKECMTDIQQVGKFLRKNGEKLGIDMDVGNKLDKTETTKFWQEKNAEAKKRREEFYHKQEEQKRLEQERQEREDAEAISRWEDEGGSFESKLKKALMLI